MYNIGIRINHGTFQGQKLVTNHNFVSVTPINIGTRIFLSAWGVEGQVYQCRGRHKPITCVDIFINQKSERN